MRINSNASIKILRRDGNSDESWQRYSSRCQVQNYLLHRWSTANELLRAGARPLASRRPNLPGRLDDSAAHGKRFSRKSLPAFPIHRITVDSADLIDQKNSRRIF